MLRYYDMNGEPIKHSAWLKLYTDPDYARLFDFDDALTVELNLSYFGVQLETEFQAHKPAKLFCLRWWSIDPDFKKRSKELGCEFFDNWGVAMAAARDIILSAQKKKR